MRSLILVKSATAMGRVRCECPQGRRHYHSVLPATAWACRALAHVAAIRQTQARLKPLAPGLTPRAVLDKFAAIQMLDAHFPTSDSRTLILSRTELTAGHKNSGPATPATGAATNHRARKNRSPPSQRRAVETFAVLALILLGFPLSCERCVNSVQQPFKKHVSRRNRNNPLWLIRIKCACHQAAYFKYLWEYEQ
jgi:hypothetical protein